MKQDEATANAEGQSKGNGYFAETSEGFFNRNDFFLFTRDQLSSTTRRCLLSSKNSGVSIPKRRA